jgi:hypothetical protein
MNCDQNHRSSGRFVLDGYWRWRDARADKMDRKSVTFDMDSHNKQGGKKTSQSHRSCKRLIMPSVDVVTLQLSQVQ